MGQPMPRYFGKNVYTYIPVMKHKTKSKYNFKFSNTPDTVALVYIATTYRLDLVSLLLLYEKYGRDIFYFFFILSGKSVTFPKATRFLRILDFAREVSQSLEDDRKLQVKPQFKEAYKRINDLFISNKSNSLKDGYFEHVMEIMNNESGNLDINTDGTD